MADGGHGTLPPQHLERVERSRQEILQAIGEPGELVFVRGHGNNGDELIWAGARELLSGLSYREVGVDELSGTNGDTAVICGGGAFCHAFHELMPHVLAVAELRFERVIVMPSSLDTSVAVVREALARTKATVFARELDSYGQIGSLCDARLAHDTSFFFDLQPYRQAGAGILHAFRTDAETSGERPLPPDNDDISITIATLDGWLARIARHASVQTDRAHVMIAAALLGKEVEYAPGSYFKVPAIAEYALPDFPVRRLAPPASPRPTARLAPSRQSADVDELRERLRDRALAAPPPARARAPLRSGVRGPTGSARVTAAILSHDRPELVLGALHSLIEVKDIPVDVLVIDNNSAPRTCEILTAACDAHPQIRLVASERNLGCAGGRRRALESIDSELVLFLDDDAELLPGALEHLVSELDSHPEAAGVTATVVIPDGRVSHSGGRFDASEEIVSFRLACSGLRFDDPGIPESGSCDWMPGTAHLVRRSTYAEFPIDPRMSSYYEDNEWCFRVTRAGAQSDCFRRSREALVLHHAVHKPWGRTDFAARALLSSFVSAAAHFHDRHGLLIGVPGVDVFAMMPELVRQDCTPDLAAARLLMTLTLAQGTDWLLMEWMNGGLDPLVGVERARLAEELAGARAETRASHAELSSARAELDAARQQLEVERSAHEHALTRLHHIYGSRLWKLGGAYDRARRRARSVMTQSRRRPPAS